MSSAQRQHLEGLEGQTEYEIELKDQKLQLTAGLVASIRILVAAYSILVELQTGKSTGIGLGIQILFTSLQLGLVRLILATVYKSHTLSHNLKRQNKTLTGTKETG